MESLSIIQLEPENVINVTGGWHDASDYLQYSTTSVNTIFQMMFAYKNYPEIFIDSFDEADMKEQTIFPIFVDEIKWGLEWMLKMNPAPGEMYNQIADDRDHIGYRLPVDDPADYGLGQIPSGLFRYRKTTGTCKI
jgi:endoglucanase